MNQMILAALALVLGTMVTVQRYSAIARGDASMIRNEAEMQAASVAKDRLEEIGTYAYDHAVRDTATANSASELTQPNSLREEQAGDADDLDDFNNVTLTTTRVADSATISFSVRTRVTYAQEANPDAASTVATKVKKATAVVKSADGLLPDSIVISQSFACGSACTW